MNVYMHKIIFGNLRGMPHQVVEKSSMGSNGPLKEKTLLLCRRKRNQYVVAFKLI